MANATAKISVESELRKVIEDLDKIATASKNIGTQLEKETEKIGDKLQDQTSKTSKFMNDLGSLSGRVASRIKDDFKALLSLQAVQSSLALSNQFKGTITQSISLSDQIRKLSGIFGIAKKDFGSFQAAMARGLGDIGLSSEAAANALQGLAETPVRGQEALLEYSKTAGELASLSGEKGREGDIAKSISSIITAQGGNPSDIGQMRAVSDQILRIRNATGQGAAEVAGTLTDLFKDVNQEFKPMLSKGGAVTLGAAAMFGGPEATGFLKSFLGKTNIERAGMEAQGLGRIIGPTGQLNEKAIQSTINEAKRRAMGNAEAGLQTMGLSEDEAKGFIRLAEAMKQNEQAINGAYKAQVDLTKQYQDSMSFSESFNASLNRFKGMFSGLSTGVFNPLRDLMNDASKSNLGAAGVVAGGGLLAAVLAGAGMKGIGGALGLGGILGGAAGGAIAKEAGATPVYVVNAAEIRGGGIGGLGGMGAGGIGLGTVGLVAAGAAVAVGAVAAGVYNEKQSRERVLAPIEKMEKKNQEDMDIAAGLGNYTGGLQMPQDVRVKVDIDNKAQNITAEPSRSRGGSQ